jgi:Lon protease-like protein
MNTIIKVTLRKFAQDYAESEVLSEEYREIHRKNIEDVVNRFIQIAVPDEAERTRCYKYYSRRKCLR